LLTRDDCGRRYGGDRGAQTPEQDVSAGCAEQGLPAPPRQRTLVATLEWSYQLLPVGERRLLRHLAALRGTIDSAIAVASGGGADSLDVVRGIRNLIAKSLRQRDLQ
jgi:predicted ATPase